jgi:hypothetical protein
MQISVTQSDWDALRFLWWPDGNLDASPKIYNMTRHVFGLTSSPGCATFALRKTAEDFGSQYSDATSRTVGRDFYVDDLLASLPSIDEAASLAHEVKALVRRGGFNLTKWTSNVPSAISHLATEDLRPSSGLVPLYSPRERALGLRWHTGSDEFTFEAEIPDRPSTKRGMLSAVSSIYDPLGLVAPMVLCPKLLLQELSRIRTGWDDPVSPLLLSRWNNWLASLDALRTINYPRCFTFFGQQAHRQLHVFSDSSEYAYGACAYLRCSLGDQTAVTLIMGKSRLAPMHQVTIPRLELAAAALASQMRNQILDYLDIEVHQVVMWSDSQVTLGYINNRSRRFKTYVANRLAIVHENSDVSEWRYVPTKANPADLASRGFSASDEVSLKLWQHGPEFLLRGAVILASSRSESQQR